MKKQLFSLLLVASVLSACGPAAPNWVKIPLRMSLAL